MKGLIRVGAYCRVSTDKDDQLNSLYHQQSYFSDYIRSHPDWQLIEIYSDEGISGTSTANRGNFNRMIQDAKSHKIDLILTKEVSRFARNTVDTLKYTRLLKEMNVTVYFINDNINTADKDSELRLTIMASIAQEESRKTSDRVKWGQKRSMENGVVFGRSLLGYTVKNGVLTVNPDEVPTVRLIFHKFLNEGKGTHVIAKELQNSGIRPVNGKKWSNTVILRVLRNEKYVGDLIQQKTYTPNFLTHKKKYNRGECETICLKNHHEPIIDRGTWDKTQAELNRRSPRKTQKSKHSGRYWCSGKIICGECGRPYVSRTKKRKDGSVYKAWRCSAAAEHGALKTDSLGNPVGCNSPSVNEKVLTACINSLLKRIPIPKEQIVWELTKQIASVQSEDSYSNPASLYKKLDEFSRKKRNALDLLLCDKNTTVREDDIKKQIEYYNCESDAIKKQIQQMDEFRIHKEQMSSSQNVLSEIRRILNFDSENDLVFRELIDRIEVFTGNQIVIYLKAIPYGFRMSYRTNDKNERYTAAVGGAERVKRTFINNI